MTPQNIEEVRLELTRLIGKKEDWNGCATYKKASLSDFHRYANDKHLTWEQRMDGIFIIYKDGRIDRVPYNSGKEFIDQDEETLSQIVELIKYNQ